MPGMANLRNTILDCTESFNLLIGFQHAVFNPLKRGLDAEDAGNSGCVAKRIKVHHRTLPPGVAIRTSSRERKTVETTKPALITGGEGQSNLILVVNSVEQDFPENPPSSVHLH